MLPAEIIELFEEIVEDYIDVIPIAINKNGSELSLIIEIVYKPDYGYSDKAKQQWSIKTIGSAKWQMSFDIAPYIEINSNHPLLWEFTDNHCQLYYTGSCADVNKLFYELFQVHNGLYQGFEPFEIHAFSIKDSFQFKNGLVCGGPKKLMVNYAEILVQNGLDYSIIGEHPARSSWDGSKWTNYDNDLQILFIGSSFIIAKEFKFEKF